MKFSQMPYERPDAEQLKTQIAALTEKLRSSADFAAADAVYLEAETLKKHYLTVSTIAQVRHSIDTRDPFYEDEVKFWNTAEPELEEYFQAWMLALLESPFRAQFEAKYGSIVFVNAEIKLKTFSPAIIPELQQEAQLVQKYENLLASAQIPFNGGVYTIAQLGRYKEDADDATRLAAWKAEGQWYKDHQQELDELYDELVHLRDAMGRKLGYDGYTELGYYRMGRNCYTKTDVEQFREAVVKYLVPVADSIYRKQAERIGKSYPLSFADAALRFRSGNPRPFGTPDQILAHGREFYDELSPETSEFFRTMLDSELLDVVAKEGKRGGGYCTEFADYELPFIFANFNGTADDVETVTHEAGHAFASWMNRKRIPVETIFPSMESCEVHSMSMEFFAWPWAEGFFGEETRKFRYSHLAGAICFIPYGTMVDHFQHVVYEKPSMTPAERHAVWKELLGVYMPWLRLDGEIPFYADGEGWQRQHHIYSSPFYYIDYCLAQTVALEFWAMIGKDQPDAWKHYMAYTVQGGSRTFTDLLKNAGLESPFDQSCLRGVCAQANEWLDHYDLTGIV